MRKYVDKQAKLDDLLACNRYKCKCGHTSIIPYNSDKILCKWCHNYVFKDKKAEFMYRVKERIK